MAWEEFEPLGKAESIEAMSRALSAVVPQLYNEGRFDGVVSIGGGQNARMAACAMKALPFGVPKIIASSLACGKRIMEQYVGDKDIMVVHTVADISGLNYITRSVINNVCHAAAGMLQYRRSLEKDGRKKLAATMLGITSKGVEGALKLLPDDKYEKTGFHANGVGGRCMENLIRENVFDIVADLSLHEITCEVLGGYSAGAKNRLTAAAGCGVPMVVAPGGLDMLDFFTEGDSLLEEVARRKKVFHNSSIVHTKIYKDEAEKLAGVVAERLNRSKAPVALILPHNGFCEASAKGGPMHDPEADEAFIGRVKSLLKKEVKVVEVAGNINSEECQQAVAEAVQAMV
jgi:uncharacterized protein (UPF0261 family)